MMPLSKKTLNEIDKIVKEQDYISIADWEKIISTFTAKDDIESAKEIYAIALKTADEFYKSDLSGGMILNNFTDIIYSIYQKNYSVELNNEFVDIPGLNDEVWANQILEDLIPKFKDFDHLLDISHHTHPYGKIDHIKLYYKYPSIKFLW